MRIIQGRERVTTHRKWWEVEDHRHPGYGWAFDADQKIEDLSEAALENLALIVCDPRFPRRLHEWDQSFTNPALGLCDICDHEVYLEGFTNTCDFCGADYNLDGQRLAPRSQWGEETGETLSDILTGGWHED